MSLEIEYILKSLLKKNFKNWLGGARLDAISKCVN